MSGVDVSAGQIRAMYRHTGRALLADGACAALACAAFWRSLSPRWLGGWALSMVAVAVARWRLSRRYERDASPTTWDASSARRWAARFAVGSAASGIAWGGAGLLFMRHASAEHRLMGALLVAGLCALAASTATLYLPAFVSFIAPALIGLGLGFALQQHSPQPELVAVVGLYGIGIFAIGRSNQHALLQALAPARAVADTGPPVTPRSEPRITRSSFPPQPNLQELNLRLEQRLAERGEALRKQGEVLRDAQRLEAIGRRAGGVAHDFNNLLTIILADISELLGQDALDEPTRKALIEVRDAASKGAALVNQLLTFSRRARSTPDAIDLNRTLCDIDRLLVRMLGEHVTLELALQQSPLNVLIDPTQLEQVILNLITNARDAMDAGVVSVQTEVVELRAPTRLLEPGRYATLSVADTGVGMDADTQRRIFDPFFTTKQPGKGTGLGLSTAYVVVQQAGGDIEVTSEPGRGSRFRVYLPLADAPRERERELAGVKNRNISGFHKLERAPRRATILLVEDEPTLRSVTRRILEGAGHTVLTSPSGEHALESAAEHSGPIDLLISDVLLPGIDGLTLATLIRSQRPELRALFISGHAREQVLPVEVEATAFLAKPFTYDALLDTVTDLLSPSGPLRRAVAPEE